MPEEDKVRATIQLLTEEGKRWQATVLGHLDATFGSTHIIGQRKPGQPHRFDPSPLGTLMQHAQPGCFLVEAKYEVDAPAQTFRSALGLTTIHDYQGSPLHFEAVVPDLIQVLPPATSTYYVTADGEVGLLPPHDQRLQLCLIDVKLTSEPGANYFAEVVYYTMTLAGWLIDNALAHRFVVIPQAAVWPGSHQASHLRQQMNIWQAQGYTPTVAELLQAMEQDIETVEFTVFAPRVRRVLQELVPQLLQEPNWRSHDWHVMQSCNACDFFGYPWGQYRNPPLQPDPDHCYSMGQRLGHLSLVPRLTRGSRIVLEQQGQIMDVATLAQQPHTSQVFDHHYELQAQRTVVPSRAHALVHDTTFIVPTSGTSAVMPRWVDMKILLAVEFDLSSAISFSFGLKAFWFEPFLTVQDQRQHHTWGPTVFFVDTRSIQQEEQVFLDFLRTLRALLAQVVQHDDRAIATGRRTARSTVQFYLWDNVQVDQLIRVVGRHLEAILADSNLRDLAWLFPAEELVPDPTMATRRSPITIVAEAVHHHLAAPVPHAYTLLNVVKHYHRPNDAAFVPTVLEYFQDPLTDLIPSERGHEIWVKKQPGPHFPGYVVRLQQFRETVEKKLRALEMVTNRLQNDLASSLSKHAAPLVSLQPLKPPAHVSLDGQLWYTFARLNAELQKLDAQLVRAMPPHEREARFKSARLSHRLAGQAEHHALQWMNQCFGLQLQPAAGRYVYGMHAASCNVSLKPGDFTYALAPEQAPDFLDRSIRSLLEGTPLETQYRPVIGNWLWARGTLEALMSAKIEAIDRDQGLLVLTKQDGRFPRIIEDLESYGLIDLSQDVILDPTSRDSFTSKLREALQAIGNPPVAHDHPLVQRALRRPGHPRRTPQTPAADLLWHAPTLQRARVQRAWKHAAKTLQQHGFDLNRSQWRAVAHALTHRLGLIWGPPGTGKSRTLRVLIMTAALEAVQQQHPLRILITAGTYTAIDNILLDLVQHLPQVLPASAYELVRIRAATQPPNPNVPAAVDIALDRYQVVPAVRTLLIQLHHNHSITIVGATPEQVHNLMQVDKRAQEELFDLLVVDEASQMDVAHTILPLCGMADGGCLVLAGDDLQLAPIHQAEAPVGLETMVGSVYDFYKKRHGIAPCALNINYRSNQTLVDFGIQAGYQPTLRAYSPHLQLHLLAPLPTALTPPPHWPAHLYWTPEWSALLDPQKPVVCFIHDDTQSSQSNPFEADAVAVLLWLLRNRLPKTDAAFGLVHDLDERGLPKPTSSQPYDDKGFWERGVGVVTPHKAQMGRIISSLTRTFPNTSPMYLRGAVDTVERFQGQERDVILGSFALGDPDAIRNEDEFLYSLNRFNVMASRARAKLILFVSQTVVDHLSNDLKTLRASRLLKTYADAYCNQERLMQLGYFDITQNPLRHMLRQGRFKHRTASLGAMGVP